MGSLDSSRTTTAGGCNRLSLASLLLTLALFSWILAKPAQANAAMPAGTAAVAGTVESSTPFTAAQVLLRNVDKRILYMVYTNAGKFRAIAMFPGNYEVSVRTKGLESDVQKLMLKAGDNPAIKLPLRAEANPPAKTAQAYDQIYPPGPGREIAERTCIVCHGENWIPSRPGNRALWTAHLDRMMGTNLNVRPASSYAEGLLTHRSSALRFSRHDRETLLDYLVTNFGPGSGQRSVTIEQEMPLDEAKLGKAMYVEYYLTEDPPGELSNSPKFNGRRRGQDPRFDQDGNVWLVDRGFPHRLVKLDPRTGEQKDYMLPDPENGHHEVLVDPTGMIWLPEHSGRKPSTTKRLLKFNPKTEKFEQMIPMDPDNIVNNEIKWLQSLAMDSKMNLYVGWIMGGALSKYERDTGKVTVFPLPNHNAIVYGVIADRNDNIFMALWDSGNIAKFNTRNNQWTTFTAPTYPGQVRRLNVDRQNNIWWGIYSAGKRPGRLAKLDQSTGVIDEYIIPRQNTMPYDVCEAPDGKIWSPDAGGSGASIWSFDPKDRTFTSYPTPQPGADMPKIQITRNGAIWFSPRGSQDWPAASVLYPDMDKINDLGAYYENGPPGYPFKTTSSQLRTGE